MLAQQPPGGVIINIASVAGMIGVERRFPYSASKGAVISMTRSIAIDFAGQGIRANAICPGTVHTPFVENYLSQNYPDTKEEVRQQARPPTPGRMGRPEEIAHAALYLASDEAAFIPAQPWSLTAVGQLNEMTVSKGELICLSALLNNHLTQFLAGPEFIRFFQTVWTA
jgi:NAD(P)-dependent dehydrogenase (short-subunit alcohol dehydrogenase family)